MKNTLTKALLVATAMSSPAVDVLAADTPRDRNPQNIPEMMDQVPNVSKGKSYDGDWNYVLSNKRFVVDEGTEDQCPGVLISKKGVIAGNLVSIFSLGTLPLETKINPDNFVSIDIDAGVANVSGDRVFDYNNSTPVDADFINKGLVDGGNDYIVQQTPRQQCKVTKNPDGTITIEPPKYEGGCGPNDTSCDGGGNTPGQPSNPGSNPLPVTYQVPTGADNLDMTKPLVLVTTPNFKPFVLQI